MIRKQASKISVLRIACLRSVIFSISPDVSGLKKAQVVVQNHDNNIFRKESQVCEYINSQEEPRGSIKPSTLSSDSEETIPG